jgi:hypothetical protein
MRTFSLVCGIKRRLNRTDPVEIVLEIFRQMYILCAVWGRLALDH